MSDSPFAPLLELQQLDTHLDQLRHKLDHLPERAALHDIEQRVAAHRQLILTVEAEHHAVTADHKRLEDELATLEAKIVSEEKRLYGGTVRASKELQAIEDELVALKHRQSDFEDLILEVLDRLEPIEARLGELAGESEKLEGEHKAASVVLAEAEAEVLAEIRDTEAQRAASVAGISPDQLALYDRLRSNVSGNAVASLTAGSCTGCHLGLPSAELARIKKLPPEEPVYCEECGALLVR